MYIKDSDKVIDVEMQSREPVALLRYTLTTKCQEIADLNFDDKIMKVIYNASVSRC
ncbi:MAG: hypothetical protein K6E22_04760 [Treponema sp.]|nr:hypothetical protein [Treponema sp.]